MKRQRYLTFFSLLFFGLFSLIASAQTTLPDSITIQSALDRALKEYPTVHQSVRTWEASVARVGLSNAATLPTVDFEAGYTRLGPNSEIVIPHSEPLETYPLDNYDIHLMGRYTVYDFGRSKTAVDVSRQRSRAIQPAIEITQSNLAMQTVQAFYSILFYRYSITAQDQLIANLEAHKTFTEKQIQTGSATDFDQLTTTVRIDVANGQKTDLENNLLKQEITLRRLLGLDDSKPVNIAGTFINDTTGIEPQSAVADALTNRPELIAAKAEESAAKMQRNLVALGERPTISSIATWGLKNGFEPNLDAIRGNWAAGLKLQVPLYDGNITGHKIAEADAQERLAHLKVSEQEKQITAEIRQCFADLNTAKSKLETVQKQVEHAQAALDNATFRYQAGTLRNIELLDAETALTQMKLLQIQAEYVFTLSEYALKKAMGNKYWQSNAQ